MNKIESKKRNTREWRTNEIFKNKARKKEREKTGVKKEEEIKQEKKKGRKKGKIKEIYKLEEEEKEEKKGQKVKKRGDKKKVPEQEWLPPQLLEHRSPAWMWGWALNPAAC